MDDDVVPGLGGLLVRGSSAWTARDEDAHGRADSWYGSALASSWL